MSRLKDLESLLSKGKISRRDFIARVSALGLMAAVSPALTPGEAQAAIPKKGGRLIMGVGGCSTTDSLDPATLPQTYPQNVNQALRNHLVEIDHKMQPIPELAESWDASPDARKWVFKLRKGVEFHNGKTMTSTDVVYSINYHRGDESKSSAKGVVDPIVEVKADGKYEVVFTLKEGNADFPFIVSDYHLAIVPEGVKGKEFEKGMGTGPYIMDTWEPGVRFFAKRNPNYWKAGRGHFDEVDLQGIADVNARTNALKTGQIHVMNRADRKTFHLLQRMSGIETIKIDATYHYTIPMRTDMKPYDNNDVRLGLKYAIDREAMLKLVLRGYGYIGNDHPIGRINRYYASELPQRKYDPEKAKFHIKKAGMLDHTFKLHAANAAFGGAVDAAVLIKESAAKAGIKIEVVREPDDGYWSSVWMKKEWCMCYWGGRPTEDWMFSTAYAEDANWNDAFWKHDRFNKLLKAARAELDEKKRRDMYVDMQRIVRDEGGTPCPVFASILSAASKKLAHGPVAGNWEFDGMRLTERWWFA